MAERREFRCVIAAGGTAGHVLPALAVAEALRAHGVRVSFAGSLDRVEARLVPEAGYEFDAFRTSGLPRRPGPDLVRSLATALRAPAACLKILRRRQPDVVLGAGGYVSGPMVLAAGLERTPAALLEADAHLGLANRLAAPFAKRVFLATPIAGRDGSKYRVTGRPVPQRARTVAAAGLPAALVPYPHATADHQTKNASQLEAAGGAVVVPEAELARVPAVVEELLLDASRREGMSRAMLEIARPDAAAEIAAELVELASA